MLTRHTLGLDVRELLWIQFRLLVIMKLGLWIVQEVVIVVGVGLWRWVAKTGFWHGTDQSQIRTLLWAQD